MYRCNPADQRNLVDYANGDERLLNLLKENFPKLGLPWDRLNLSPKMSYLDFICHLKVHATVRSFQAYLRYCPKEKWNAFTTKKYLSNKVIQD